MGRSLRSVGLSLAIATLLSSGCSEPPTDSGIPFDPRIEEIRGLLRDGQFDEGLARAQALAAEAREAHGARSIQVARALDLVAEHYWRSQQAAAADGLDAAEQAIGLKRDLGASKAEIAISLRNVAKLAEGRGETERAEDIYNTMVGLRRKAFGRDSSEVALAMLDLAQLYQTSGQQKRAAPLYERVLEIQTRRPDDPWIAYTLNNLAIVRYDLGEYDEARSLYERALVLKEKKAEDCPGRLNVAWTLNALALLLVEMGEYDEAEALYERALSIRRECLGQDHSFVALVLVNLAGLARLRGDYVGAKRFFEEALRIETASYGAEHREVIETQNNLAGLCFDMGDYSEAERLYGQAVSFWERTPNPDRRFMADALQGLASTLTESGDYARARELQDRALSMLEASDGKRGVEYAFSLDRFAVLLDRTGDRSAAIEIRGQALEIFQQALGEKHPRLVEQLTALAELHLKSGAAGEARPLLDRALAISRDSLGENHPVVADVLRVRGLALAASGDVRTALESALRAEEIGRQHLELTVRFLPERQALRYASVRSSGLDLALSLVAAGSDAESTRQVWDSLSRSRAMVLDEMAARRRATREASDPTLAELARQLEARSRRLANLWVRGIGSLDPERYRSLLDSAARDVEDAQQRLAATSDAFRRDHGRESRGLSAIVAALPPRTALVGFAIYDRPDLAGGRATPSYLAFVLPDAQAEPLVIPLGPARVIDRQVERWSREAGRGAHVAGRSIQEAESVYRTVGEELRRTVWDPIAARLSRPERILVVPDGALNLVNLASLPIDATAYLVESAPPMQYLSAERDLVLGSAGRGGEGLLAVGGPDFDRRPGAAGARASELEAATGAVRGGGTVCDGLRSVRFEPLAAAASETEEIVRLWTEADRKSQAGRTGAADGVLLLTRDAASESAFKHSAPGRRVVHLATHGFFLGGDCSAAPTATRGIEGLRPASTESESPAAIDDPLLLSGLALAGANHREEAQLDEENGILTAAEIATMDLTGVEWAVLSACDTGVGELQAGEGVLGLRRAFQIAGARSTIMSLWAVDDEFARRFMVELYHERLSEGAATDQAVRQATLRLLQQARRSGKPHPYYWAGFVATGDWR